MMMTNNSPMRQNISADCNDPLGARSWMSNICGPHLLNVARPEKIRFHHSGNVLPSMSTTLGHVEYGTDVTIGIADDISLNCYSISLPLSGEQELSKAGSLLRSDPDLGVIVCPFERQELTIAGDCSKLQVAIPNAAMNQVLETLLGRLPTMPLIFEPQMDAIEGGSAAWWRMARHIIEELDRSKDLYSHQLFTRDIESALIKGLILTQPNNYSTELLQSGDFRLPHYLLRARDFIINNARQPISLEDIELASGISRFKLFEGFKRHFGIAPMAYLKRHRLTEVRREILEDQSARNISSIALSWGFNHLGRFSSEYKKMFSEPPSTTISRMSKRRLR